LLVTIYAETRVTPLLQML